MGSAVMTKPKGRTLRIKGGQHLKGKLAFTPEEWSA